MDSRIQGGLYCHYTRHSELFFQLLAKESETGCEVREKAIIFSFSFWQSLSIYFEVGSRSKVHLCFGLNLGLSLLNDLAVVKAHTPL